MVIKTHGRESSEDGRNVSTDSIHIFKKKTQRVPRTSWSLRTQARIQVYLYRNRKVVSDSESAAVRDNTQISQHRKDNEIPIYIPGSWFLIPNSWWKPSPFSPTRLISAGPTISKNSLYPGIQSFQSALWRCLSSIEHDHDHKEVQFLRFRSFRSTARDDWVSSAVYHLNVREHRAWTTRVIETLPEDEKSNNNNNRGARIP